MHVNPKLPKYTFPLFFPSMSFLFCQSSIQSIALLIRFIDEAIVMSSTRALKCRTWERTNRRDWLESCNLRTMIGLLMYYWIMSSWQKKNDESLKRCISVPWTLAHLTSKRSSLNRCGGWMYSEPQYGSCWSPWLIPRDPFGKRLSD